MVPRSEWAVSLQNCSEDSEEGEDSLHHVTRCIVPPGLVAKSQKCSEMLGRASYAAPV